MRLLAAASVICVVVCWAGVIYCAIIGQFELAVGLAFASLFLPLVMEALDEDS